LLHLVNNINHPKKMYVGSIVQACVKQTAYDPQSEMERTQYLYEVIQYSGFSAAIQKQIHMHLIASEDEENAQQMLRLVKRFADDGNLESKEAIRKVFRFSSNWNCFIGAEELICIDQIKGFQRVVGEIGKKIVEDEYYETDFIFDYAVEELGEDTVNQFFISYKDDQYANAYLNSVLDYKNKDRDSGNSSEPYDVIRESIETKELNRHWTSYMHWGVKASEDDIFLAATDLLKQSKPYKLLLYLSIFQKRPFPLDIDSIISWARSTNKKISNKAFLVLRNIKSEAVYELAIESLNNNKPNRYALELLILNYKAQDLALLENMMFKKQTKHSFHSNALDIMHIFEENSDPSATGLLLHIYNTGWCTHCREGFIDIMLVNDMIPASIREELKYDCNLDIREKVEQYELNRH